jgi:hypothetical protein
MTFVSVYQRDSMLIKSLELKLTIYKLTLNAFNQDQVTDISKLRELSSLIFLYIKIGLKCQVEEDFTCYLDDISICCIALEQQILVCGSLGVLADEDIKLLLDIKKIIYDFIGLQIDQNRGGEYYELLYRRFG